MTSDIKSLTDAELNHAVAIEVMVWKLCGEKVWGNGEILIRDVSDWDPTGDDSDKRHVLNRIKELGLQRELVANLPIPQLFSNRSFNWYLLTCPPRDIAEAALQAVRETRGAQ